MPRLTISMPSHTHNRIAALSIQKQESLSNVINQLIQIGMYHLDEQPSLAKPVEEHCQQLIMQMNVLVKNLSAEILKFNQSDFEQLRQVTAAKYNEFIMTDKLTTHTSSKLSKSKKIP